VIDVDRDLSENGSGRAEGLGVGHLGFLREAEGVEGVAWDGLWKGGLVAFEALFLAGISLFLLAFVRVLDVLGDLVWASVFEESFDEIGDAG